MEIIEDMSNGTETTGAAGKATIYMKGGYGMIKIEVRSIEFKEKSYAQYSAAYSVTWIKKGARSKVGIMQCDYPSMLVIEGWGHPDVDDAFGPPVESGPGVSVSRGRYMSCDPRWQSDFDTRIDPYVARIGAKVVLDLRAHNPHKTRAVAVAA